MWTMVRLSLFHSVLREIVLGRRVITVSGEWDCKCDLFGVLSVGGGGDEVVVLGWLGELEGWTHQRVPPAT